jgi:hypothetical protein
MAGENFQVDSRHFGAALPDVAQKGDITGLVNSENRIQAVTANLHKLVVASIEGISQHGITRCLLGMWNERPAPEELRGIMMDCLGVVEDAHAFSMQRSPPGSQLVAKYRQRSAVAAVHLNRCPAASINQLFKISTGSS